MKIYNALFALAFVSPLGISSSAEARPGDRRELRREVRREVRREDRRDDRRDARRDYRRGGGGYYPGPGYYYPSPGYYRPGYPRRDRGTDYYGEVNCSPEVKQKNVAILESTVNGLMATPAFSDASQFRDAIASIQSQGDLEARIAAYCNLVGVDATNPSEIAEFVGARDLAPYVENARVKLSLTHEQADVLVRTLSENLLGGLND